MSSGALWKRYVVDSDEAPRLLVDETDPDIIDFWLKNVSEPGPDLERLPLSGYISTCN